MKRVAEWLKKSSVFFNQVEDGFLSVLLVAMVLLSFSQIMLRNVFDYGLVWADPVLRQMVMWVFLVGAAIATRNHNHINVNIIARFLPKRLKAAVQVLTDLFAVIICGILTYASVQLVWSEYTQPYEEPLMGVVPMWGSMIIMPIAFGLITIRFFRYMVVSFLKTIGVLSLDSDEDDAQVEAI